MLLRHALASAAVGGLITLTGPAEAAGPTLETCIESHEQAQILRRESRFREAKNRLHVCVSDGCPAIARKDCAAWLADVERDEPTLVVVANGVQNGRVFVDGALVAESIDGKAIPVDPGRHVVKVTSAGRERETEVLVVTGDRNRHVELDLSPPPPPPSTSPVAPIPSSFPPSPEAKPSHGLPAMTWVLGGVSAVALGSFGAFALMGTADEKCVPTCSRGQIDDFRRSYLIADVSLGIGLIAAAGALWFALSDR